jgi:4-amino-4-deoxy-L-arabinose transferase-like glycosyltransferase
MERSSQLADPADPQAQAGTRPVLAWWERLGARSLALPLGIVLAAAVLRLWSIELQAPNPFYDAAVRSMGLSWHNFFFGALDPSGKLAIDKPPVDLWLQVASTKLLGFNRDALALPEALGGMAAVALLYAAVTRACGRVAGGIAALALAVLPIAVLTSRSDTMDSVMSALTIAALWSAIVAAQTRHARWALLSAALVGIAFDVKLAQALVPLPALALMWCVASSPRRRALLIATSAVVLVVVAMAWAFTASSTPLSGRPFPMGSHTGSIYRAMFVFDGIDRITGTAHEATPYGFSSPPGLARLLGTGGMGGLRYSALIGLELVGAVALLIAVGALWLLACPRMGDRDRAHSEDAERMPGAEEHPSDTVAGDRATVRRLVAALAVWLATAYVLFSFMGRLQPRYLEAMSPAVAGALGIATAYLLARAHTRRGAWLCAGGLAVNAAFAVGAVGVSDGGVQLCLLATIAALAGLCVGPLRRLPFQVGALARPRLRAVSLAVVSLALLAAPAEASIDLVEERSSDANPTGSGAQYSAYLHSHHDDARYEVAAANPLAVVGLIAQDAQPVLVLRSIDGVLVSVGQLRQLVRDGGVRFAILPHPCASGRHCTPTTAWTVRHAVEVLPGLYRYRDPGLSIYPAA